MRTTLIAAVAVTVLASAGLLGTSTAAAADDPQPLLSGPLLEDNMPRAQTGQGLPIPRLLTAEGPWGQQPPPVTTFRLPPTLGFGGGVQKFDTPEDLDRHLQWEDFIRSFERLLQQLRG